MRLGNRSYKLSIEDADTGEVLVTTRTHSVVAAWFDPVADTIQTFGEVSPGFAGRLVMEQLGGPRGAVEKLGHFLARKAAAKSP